MLRNLQNIILILSFFFFLFFYSHIFAQSTISISDTVSVSATVVGGPTTTTTPHGGGGPSYPNIGVFFSGTAYPFAKVNILKDGQFALQTVADQSGNFFANIGSLSTGNYTFSLYAIDKYGLRSNPYTFQIFINSGVTTSIHDIILGPTLGLSNTIVRLGDSISIFGQGTPLASVIISINSFKEIFKSAQTDSKGYYKNYLDTSELGLGKYTAKSKTIKNAAISPESRTINFTVVDKNQPTENKNGLKKCDLNQDGRCNLVDFSIAAFWYNRPLSKEFAEREKKYLNGDGKIDLVDFSIMAYYWTG